uniref:hypothetical protein n=1 Tax=Sulfurovum sp. TaxID=1969726 RepID=UPI0025D8C4A6
QIAIDRYKDGHKETLGHVIKKLNEAKLKKLKEGYRQKQNKLIKMGASEMEVAKALAGKSGSVNKLIKKLHDRKEKAEKEERREKVAKREKEKKRKS